MNKLILVAILFLTLSVKAQNIDFVENNWTKAKAAAAEQKKYLFVDCYTNWCSWCKVMDKKTFPDKDVVTFFNTNFIALKLEMEHNYGINVAMKYRITGFPSYLVFAPDGRLVDKFFGYMEPTDFLTKLKSSVNPTEHPGYPGVTAAVDLNYPEFYQKAFGGKEKRSFPKDEEVNAFLDKQTYFFSEVNYNVLMRFAGQLSEKHRNQLFDNKAKYEQLYGMGEIEDAVYAVANRMVKEGAKTKNINGLEDAERLMEKHLPARAAESKPMFRLAYYRGVEDWTSFAKEVDNRVAEGLSDGNTLNDYSWTIYEKCDDQTVIVKAIDWIKPVIEKTPDYAAMDTYAALLYKAKRYSEAKTYAEKAIALGKANGDKTSETEELLKKIESAK